MDEKIKRALIFGAAPCKDWSFLPDYLKLWPPDFIICADGGLNAAQNFGLCPDYVIGDWDSGGKPVSGADCQSLPMEKDYTDLEASVDQAISLGATQLLLCGCTGGRLDHTASNLTLLEGIDDRGATGLIVDSCSEVRLLKPGLFKMSDFPVYHYISLIPLDREVNDVTLRGFKYPLEHATLRRGSTLSVSNEPMISELEIIIGSGNALLIRCQRDN